MLARPAHLLRAAAILLFILLPEPAEAFDPPMDTAGPLTIRIEGPAEVGRISEPVAYRIVLENSKEEPLTGQVSVAGIDGWTARPEGPVRFRLQGKGRTALEFAITAPASTLHALYPIHARVEFTTGGQRHQAHAVLILSANNPSPLGRAAQPLGFSPVPVPAGGELSLLRMQPRRSIVAVFGQRPQAMPAGWQGSEPTTRAHIEFGASVRGEGEPRSAIAIHPPYHEGRSGTAAVQYPLRLPAEGPIRLRFAHCIRAHDPAREPPSDGVTFRVRVMPFGAGVNISGGKVVYEKHTDSKSPIPADVDLSEHAGQAVILQLESDPGPKKDTTCDLSYWVEPTLVTGQKAAGPQNAPAARVVAGPRVLGTLAGSSGQWEVSVQPGERGLLDAAIEFRKDRQRLSFKGFHVRVGGANLEQTAGPPVLREVKVEPAGEALRMRHQFEDDQDRFDLVIELAAGGAALKARVWLENAPAPKPWQVTYLEDVAAGQWSEKAARVYAGTGNVIQEPQSFDLGYDGHRLATCFVGFDFANGVSLVQAVDAVPNRLSVQPDRRHYSLHSPHPQNLYFIPAADVWAGVREWRQIDPREASPGVPKLAGRFVFDWWGGDYAGSAKALERSFRYGLTNSVVIWHNWQRFGYDNRLPDIWPPNPKYGTPEQFKALAELCEKHGVLFAPHDNYIDYYPDAAGYSYDHIAFTHSGEPVKAWFNPGPKAQSYRWRADRVRPVLERNLKLINEAIAPTAYFIDVWSSIEPYDYWTREGEFHDRLETTKTWAELFTWIRDAQKGAPQISESGHDALIGALDGATCNHLRVGSPEGAGDDRWFLWDIRCADSERIPWFDAAYHDRFVLHGAGYENRFRAGLDRRQHGMYSDDYISTEVLDGHPAMVGQPFGRDVVRKYWLLNDLMTMLSFAHMHWLEFVGGDLHRMHVEWRRRDISYLHTDGTERWQGPQTSVWVNRGKTDWEVEGHRLPQYGWYARCSNGVEASVETLAGRTVEWSSMPGRTYYLNAGRPQGQASQPAPGARDDLLHFGPISTNGAARIQWEGGGSTQLTITAPPDEPPCTIQIRWPDLHKPSSSLELPTRMELISETGEVLRRAPTSVGAGVVMVKTEPGVFAYRLVP